MKGARILIGRLRWPLGFKAALSGRYCQLWPVRRCIKLFTAYAIHIAYSDAIASGVSCFNQRLHCGLNDGERPLCSCEEIYTSSQSLSLLSPTTSSKSSGGKARSSARLSRCLTRKVKRSCDVGRSASFAAQHWSMMSATS